MRQAAFPSVLLVLSFTFHGFALQGEVQAQGVWTQLKNPNPAGLSGVPILLSDGTVMVCSSTGAGGGVSPGWNKLTPDSSGNYINGTWSSLAPMNQERLYFASNVLPSGKVFVMGGEYSDNSGVGSFINTGEIYDPVANKWTYVAAFPQPLFGDDPTELLTTGKILCGYIISPQTYLYDPVANSWSETGSKLNDDQSDEEAWVLLPDNSVLSYNVFASPATGAGSAQRYVPSKAKWEATGPVPVPLTNLTTLGAELGPALLLMDGRVFQIGANNNTVIYTPSTNTWVQGPSLPTNMGCDDAPGCVLPNGHVLFIADNSQPQIFSPPSRLYDFDPVANTITDVTPGGELGNTLESAAAFTFTFLVLPNGHVLLTTGYGGEFGPQIFDYAPTGSPSATWEPKITSVAKVTGTEYVLKGTQLNGLNEGSCYGDDVGNSTNYPIVRMKDVLGNVRYAKTTNWSPGLVASGALQTSVDFTLPAGTQNGTYQLSVIANGISSPYQEFVIGAQTTTSNVTAVYSSVTKTLTLTGDNNANSLTVTYAAGVITVLGANGTRINNGPSFTTAFSGKLILNATMNDGDDALSVIGVASSTTNINMGAGNDTTGLTLCNIADLIANGGTGTNLFIATSSVISQSTITEFLQ